MQQHQLSGRMIEDPRFGRGADDFSPGWYWSCICGEDNTKLNWRLPHTEAEALEQLNKHLERGF